jgi:hypothetical protein
MSYFDGKSEFSIAVTDNGRHKIKGAVIQGKQVHTDDFFSYIGEYVELDFHANSEDDMIVQIGKKGEKGTFFVGDLARRAGNHGKKAKQDSKAHEQNMVFTLTMLHRLGVVGNVKLGTVVPIENHRSDAKKMKKMLLGEHIVTVNGVERRMNIIDVLIGVEGGATYYVTPEEETEDRVVHIMGIGSEKSNFATYDHNGRYVHNQSGSSSTISWEKFRNFSKAARPEAIAKAIYSEVGGYHWDLPYEDEYGDVREKVFYVAGGAADMLLSEIRKFFPNVRVAPNPLYSDCLGMLHASALEWVPDGL